MGKLKERIIEKIAEKNHLTSELHYDLLLKKYEVSEDIINVQREAIDCLQGSLKSAELSRDIYKKKYEVSESTIETQKEAIALLQGNLNSAELSREIYKNAYYELLDGLDDDPWAPSECGLCNGRKLWIHDGEEIKYCPRCGRLLQAGSMT